MRAVLSVARRTGCDRDAMTQIGGILSMVDSSTRDEMRTQPSRVERDLIGGGIQAITAGENPDPAQRDAMRAWPELVPEALRPGIERVVTASDPSAAFAELRRRLRVAS